MQHQNYVTGHVYAGHNVKELEAVRLANGYRSGLWLTFLQARELGIQIKKGQHSTAVFRGFSELTEDGKTKTVPLGFARVFNIDQTNAPADMIEHDLKVLAAV